MKQISDPVRINRSHVAMLLAAYGVSGRELARLAGVHPVTVTRVLRNRRYVTHQKRIAVLHAIAARCGREVDELVLGRLAA